MSTGEPLMLKTQKLNEKSRGRPKTIITDEDIIKQQEKYKEHYQKKQEEKAHWRNEVSTEQREIIKKLKTNIYPNCIIRKLYEVILDATFDR